MIRIKAAFILLEALSLIVLSLMSGLIPVYVFTYLLIPDANYETVLTWALIISLGSIPFCLVLSSRYVRNQVERLLEEKKRRPYN